MNFQKKLWSVVSGGLVLAGATSNMIGVTARGGIDDQVRSVNLRQLPQLNQSERGDDNNSEKFNFEDNAWTYKTSTKYWNSYGRSDWKDCAMYDCHITEKVIHFFIQDAHRAPVYSIGIMVWMDNFAAGFDDPDPSMTPGIFQDTIEHSKLQLRGDRWFWKGFQTHMGGLVNFLDQYDTQGWTGPVEVQFFYIWQPHFRNIYRVAAFRS